MQETTCRLITSYGEMNDEVLDDLHNVISEFLNERGIVLNMFYPIMDVVKTPGGENMSAFDYPWWLESVRCSQCGAHLTSESNVEEQSEVYTCPCGKKNRAIKRTITEYREEWNLSEEKLDDKDSNKQTARLRTET